MNFVLKWIITAVAVAAAVWIVPGISVVGSSSVAAVCCIGLVLALINMSIKPIMQVLSLPITIITLGIFYLVVNTIMLYLAAWIGNGLFDIGFQIASFGSAFLASIVISIVSSILGGIVK